MTAPTRVPPSSLEAEQALLGAMLLEGEAIDAAVTVLAGPDDFYRDAHKTIYRAVIGLRYAGEPCDLTTLSERLAGKGELEKCGGRPYLAALFDAVPTAAHAEYYARIVAEKAILRRLIAASSDTVDECFGEVESAEEVVCRAEARVRAVVSKNSYKTLWAADEVVAETCGAIQDAREKAATGGAVKPVLSGVPTGIGFLDDKTGGFQGGDLVLVGGQRSNGKTAFCLNMMIHSAKRGVRGLYATLEMSRGAIGMRLAQSEARIDSALLRSGAWDEGRAEDLADAYNRLAALPFHVEEMIHLTPMRLLAKARQIGGLGAIYVDYLQKVRPDAGRYDDDRARVESVIRALKDVARELMVPVVVVSSLSREGNLRESGLIDYEADLILFLRRDEKVEAQYLSAYGDATEGTRVMQVRLDKQRNGWTGRFYARFIAPWALWMEMPPGWNLGVPVKYGGGNAFSFED